MSRTTPLRSFNLRRSVLSVPAINLRALEKSHSLDCDAVIFDLEDSVAPEKKGQARENLRAFFAGPPLEGKERIIRINSLSSEFGAADLDLVKALLPDAVLLPKVDEPQDVTDVSDLLAAADAPEELRIWAMIETPRGVLNVGSIAGSGRTAGSRLDCLVVGLNDLRKETGVLPQPGRTYLVPWLMQVILAVKAYGLDALDSVFNDFRDGEGFDAECGQGRAMGFAGKMLIHPAQIEVANRHFGPSLEEIAEAEAIISAFADPDASGLNVINVNGRMIERLHLVQAEALVHKARLISARRPA
ncbi:citrate lyase beta subunit protein [Rhizobium phaseoli]|uniref:Citrate lyase beta subunit protein n=2 Tax=Rhizobium TaxID=379 RepID=A0A192TF83_9HYPH|nr:MULTISPECIES: CoA ester lyase [Rhizobium]ACE93305.1 citrate lyase protein, beta subunit [Rhizobium etli CIAT 652]MDH6648742.1 citrate lyase subunit beta/citryl-CoA lyase [Rhizobium esperanzae]ANL30070.1 citrate lyase beta subunit protein [Rhizobium phaseoli]ANL42696.1 citrate lyase beta subunit protein [Rhizobium phaseoli]ANL55371.1 citrate lyase beta subunit protein [Rhizobium phaseoli]